MSQQQLRREDFQVCVLQESGHSVIALFGELDLASAPELERTITDAHACSGNAIVVDLSGLSFMDSSGIAVLVRASRTARGRGQAFVLRRANAQVRRLFEVTGVSEVFEDWRPAGPAAGSAREVTQVAQEPHPTT